MSCPLRYRFRVIDRIPEPPSPAASRGTLVHLVLERLFELPAVERTAANAATLLAPAWRDLLRKTPELQFMFPRDDPEPEELWLNQAQQLINRWFTLEDPTRLEPGNRELFIETTLPDGLTLRGYIDRLDVSATGQLRVVDYKTGRSPQPAFEATALFQMRFYALILWRSRAVLPDLLQLVYLGDGQLLRHVPSTDELLATERKILALWQAIDHATRSGQWVARRSRLCDWCSFKSLCPEWGGTPPPLPARPKGSAPAPTGST
jgi:putative RecB family exonuclease